MPGRLPISFLSALVWTQLTAAVPADPTITAPAVLPRQNNDRFIGWVEISGTWYSETCSSGLTWYQDGKYAQCCPTTLASCYAPTACVDGSLIYPYSDLSSTTTIACTENFGNPSFSICNTAFIFENFDSSNPQTDIVCGASSVNWSYYRKIPASATEEPSSNTESTSPEPVTSGSETSRIPLPTPVTEEKSESKAWIAGAVVGPIVGLAIIGLVIFFLMRRKKKDSTTAATATTPQVGPAPGVTEAKPTFNQDVASAQPSPGYNYTQDPYNQAAYGPTPASPAPQYGAPYPNQPGSPPPAGHYAPDVKQPYEQPMPQAAELGGASSQTAGTHTAELDGGSVQPK